MLQILKIFGISDSWVPDFCLRLVGVQGLGFLRIPRLENTAISSRLHVGFRV